MELDTELAGKVSSDYALALFNGEVGAYWKVRTDHQSFERWLAQILKHTQDTVKRAWPGQGAEWWETFEVVCLPAVMGALNNARDEWRIKSLDEEERAAKGGSRGETDVTTDDPTLTEAEPSCAASWDRVEISFLSDERVQIRNGTRTETRNYAELGFADSRSGKPNRAWETLRALAEANGIIQDGASTAAAWTQVEKRIQEIRKTLRSHFDISTDPIPFVGGTGYRAYFKIGCGPSFDT
jgi:hypothetical protein